MVFTTSAVVSALDRPAAVLDRAGRLVARNDAWRQASGLPADPGELVPAAFPSQTRAAMADAVAGVRRGESAEVDCQLSDGGPTRLRVTPLLDSDGAPHALVTVTGEVGAPGQPPARRPGSDRVGRGRPAIEPLPGGRVLLAEDNDVNREIIGRMLELLGLHWDGVPDGAAAVAAAAAGAYDVILMDVQMPGTDGLEATRRIRLAEGNARTPIVALTASVLREEETYLAAGMDDYLAKPMRLAALRATLQRYLALEPAPALPDLDESRLAELDSQLRDPTRVAATVELFLADLPARCLAIGAAGGRLDRIAVQEGAHSLRSASAVLGATALADLCERLEAVADGAEEDDLRKLATAIGPVGERAETAIRRYLSRRDPPSPA